MTEYLWKKFQEHQQFLTISILFPIPAPWLIIIPRNFTTNFYLISNRGSKFLSNNLVNRSLARSSLPSLIFDQILIIGLISEDQTCLENRGRGISSSCWSWPRERCSIEISPYTSLGIQVSKILIIFIYNIYISLSHLTKLESDRERFNAHIYQFPLFQVPARNTTDLRSI